MYDTSERTGLWTQGGVESEPGFSIKWIKSFGLNHHKLFTLYGLSKVLLVLCILTLLAYFDLVEINWISTCAQYFRLILNYTSAMCKSTGLLLTFLYLTLCKYEKHRDFVLQHTFSLYRTKHFSSVMSWILCFLLHYAMFADWLHGSSALLI